MVGLIPKLLLDCVAARAGRDAALRVLELAGISADRRHRLDLVYPDEEWQRLLAAACEVLALSQGEVEEAFADYFGRDALARWPVWFQMSRNARQFLERQQTIHNTFATGVRDPQARRGIEDKFRIEGRDRELIAHYRSPNHLCGLYKALARWVLTHYGESATIEEATCMRRGDAACRIHIRWEGSS